MQYRNDKGYKAHKIYFKIPIIQKYFFKKVLSFSHGSRFLDYISEQNINNPCPCNSFSLAIEQIDPALDTETEKSESLVSGTLGLGEKTSI